MSSTILRFLAEPGVPNFNGKVHGGSVMKWIDEASYACATTWAHRPCVAVFIGSIQFLRPVRIGQLVEVEARLVYTGDTSMNMAVEVRSSDMQGDGFVKTTDCLTVFVALGDDGQPLPVTALQPATPGEVALAERVRAYLDAARRSHAASTDAAAVASDSADSAAAAAAGTAG